MLIGVIIYWKRIEDWKADQQVTFGGKDFFSRIRKNKQYDS